ncbi:MAG: type II secretion system protein GspJ [Thiothrix sp.]|nr:MAG: type II secretion system protein GspJ [Thiothrix sp.]
MTIATHKNYWQRGFTLLELVIAIGIFAILSALAYGGLNSILRASSHTLEAGTALQDLQLAIGIIQQDFSQITPRSVRDESGEQQPALKSELGTEELIRFTRRGWRNPTLKQRSTLQRVAYLLEENTLMRRYWHHLDRAPNPQSVSLPLLEGIEEVTFQFRENNANSLESWPPQRDKDTSALLPRAIEITLKTERWGEISRLIPLLEPVVIAPPANSDSNSSKRPGANTDGGSSKEPNFPRLPGRVK